MCLLTKKMAVLSSTFWGWSSIGRSSRRRFLPPRFAGFDVHVHRREWQGLRLNTRMTLKIFFRSNEMFAHRKSVDEFNSTSCRIVPLRNHLEHVRLWSTIFDYHVYIYIYSYMTCISYIKVMHMMITRLQIHVPSRVWKNLCLPFLETHIHCMCSFQCLYSKAWLDTKVAFGNEQLHPCADSHFDSFKWVQFTVTYRQMSDSRDL